MFILIILTLVSLAFPPFWVVAVLYAIYLFATKKKRRNKIIIEEIVKMIITGQKYNEANITFADARAFSKAMGGGVTTNASGVSAMSEPHSFNMDYENINYTIIFLRNKNFSGTCILVSKVPETLDELFEKKKEDSKQPKLSLDDILQERYGVKKAERPKRLIDLVNKQDVSKLGCFLNAHDELVAVAKNKPINDDLIKMAYGYAIRMVGAGLYIQGVIDKSTYQQIHNSFKHQQATTKQSVEFQENACSQAIELVLSYDHSLTEEDVRILVIYVDQNIEYLPENNPLIPFEKLINKIDAFKQETLGLSPEVVRFINETLKGVSARIKSPNEARQLIMEELDAARQGNKLATNFVKNSGFDPLEYKGAMDISYRAVDGKDGPQQFLLNALLPYSSNIELMVGLRLEIVKKLIKLYDIEPTK